MINVIYVKTNGGIQQPLVVWITPQLPIVQIIPKQQTFVNLVLQIINYH